MDFNNLVGKMLVRIVNEKGELVTDGDTEVFFHTSDGHTYHMYHQQDCCESVYLSEVHGDLNDLLKTPILKAEEINNVEDRYLEKTEESYTWTFYRIITVKGDVTLRWLGTSNGYYSEGVSFEEVGVDDN